MNTKASQRSATRQALLNALRDELVSGARLSVEAIAARAAVNKALVYRYFGDLAGLLGAFAESDDFMPDAGELLALCSPRVARLKPHARFAQCIQAYVKALAKRPATVQILLRLHTLDAPALAAIAARRQRAAQEIRRAFGHSDDAAGFDADLAFNLLVAGACHLLGSGKADWAKGSVDRAELADRIVLTLHGLLESDPRG